MRPNKNRQLIITGHAYERCEQLGMRKVDIAPLFWESLQEKLPQDLRKYAARTHQKYHELTRYYRNGTYVMVASETTHKRTGDNIYLLLTVYDQRLDLRG